MSEADAKLHELQGQILGLQSILTAIVEDNPDILINQDKIGRLIQDATVEHVDVQIKARTLMHAVSSNRDTR